MILIHSWPLLVEEFWNLFGNEGLSISSHTCSKSLLLSTLCKESWKASICFLQYLHYASIFLNLPSNCFSPVSSALCIILYKNSMNVVLDINYFFLYISEIYFFHFLLLVFIFSIVQWFHNIFLLKYYSLLLFILYNIYYIVLVFFSNYFLIVLFVYIYFLPIPVLFLSLYF